MKQTKQDWGNMQKKIEQSVYMKKMDLLFGSNAIS